MRELYFANVTLHVLAALLWLGGMFFLGVVGAPVLRHVQPPELRQRLFLALGTRFRAVGWWAVAVLVATGTLNLWFRGYLHWALLTSPGFWRSNFGGALAVKLVAVTTMLVVQAVHDFIDGPAAGRAVPGSAEALALRQRAAWLARINAMLGIVLVLAAVRLAR